MREIKFRFWNKVSKEMIYEPFLKNTEGRILNVSSMPNAECMQYTGLKDKHGKEIYFDSDIVQAIITDDYTGEETKFSGILYINLKRFKICMKGHEDFNLQFAEELEIIGNIHENPELLK